MEQRWAEEHTAFFWHGSGCKVASKVLRKSDGERHSVTHPWAGVRWRKGFQTGSEAAKCTCWVSEERVTDGSVLNSMVSCWYCLPQPLCLLLAYQHPRGCDEGLNLGPNGRDFSVLYFIVAWIKQDRAMEISATESWRCQGKILKYEKTKAWNPTRGISFSLEPELRLNQSKSVLVESIN